MIDMQHLELKESQQLEKIAELCHTQWANWMKHMFSKNGSFTNSGTWIMDADAVDGSLRQAISPYERLSHEDKEKDRREAKKFLIKF